MIQQFFPKTLHRVSISGLSSARKMKPPGIFAFGLLSDEKTFIEEKGTPFSQPIQSEISLNLSLILREIKASCKDYSIFQTLGAQKLIAKKSTVGTPWFKEILLLTAVAEARTSIDMLHKMVCARQVWKDKEEIFFSSINGQNNYWSFNGLADLEQKAFLCRDNCIKGSPSLSQNPTKAIAKMCGIYFDDGVPLEKHLEEEVATLALMYLQQILGKSAYIT